MVNKAKVEVVVDILDISFVGNSKQQLVYIVYLRTVTTVVVTGRDALKDDSCGNTSDSLDEFGGVSSDTSWLMSGDVWHNR